MEFTAQDAKDLIHAVWAVLSSPLAQRFYVLGLGALTLWVSFLGARKGDRMVREHAVAAGRRLRNKRRGRPPRNPDAIAVKIKTILAIYWDGMFGSLRGVGLGLLCGVLIPACVLFAVTLFYSWFDANGAHLLDGQRNPQNNLGAVSASLFVADQTFRGGLFDLIEIFEIEIAQIQHNPANVWFSAGLFGYHFFVSAFVFSGLLLYREMAWKLSRQAVHEIRRQRTRYRDQLAASESRNPPN